MMMPTSGCFLFELSFAGMQRSSANGRAVGAQETDKFIAHCRVLENLEQRSAVTPEGDGRTQSGTLVGTVK